MGYSLQGVIGGEGGLKRRDTRRISAGGIERLEKSVYDILCYLVCLGRVA